MDKLHMCNKIVTILHEIPKMQGKTLHAENSRSIQCLAMNAPTTNLRFAIRLLLACSLFLSGCANMSDGNKTRAQGTALGAVGGAILGAGVGALCGLASGKPEDIIAGAIIGGAAGAVGGGVLGYNYGKEVAEKKAQYANSEQFYAAQINECDQNTAAIKKANVQLSRSVAELEKRKANLDQQLAAGQIDRNAYKLQFATLKKDAQIVRAEADPAEKLVGYQKAVLEDAKDENASPEIQQQLAYAVQTQENAYKPIEESLARLTAVEKPTKG